jgi:hypothetical protein
MRRTALLLVIGMYTGLAAACGGDDDPTQPEQPTDFVAALTSTASTDASGTATFEAPSTSVSFRIEVQSLEGATAARIHIGADGPAVLNLFSNSAGVDVASGVLAEGTITAEHILPGTSLTLAQVAQLIASENTFLTITTIAHPQGEIRGQITAEEEG